MPDVDDKTQVDVDKDTDTDTDELDKDVKDDDTSSDDDDGEKTGSKAQEFVSDILDEYGLDSPEDLKEFLSGLSGLKGKVGDRDLDELIKNSETLENYQEHWAKQEREKKKEGETPEDTISRLEKENEENQNERRKESDQRKQAKDAEHAIEAFNDTVDSAISADETIPKEYRPYLSEFLGVNNPINEVDIENNADVRKLTKAGAKKLLDFEQAVIKRYRAGKTKVPKVSSTDTTPVPSDKDKEPKTLKESRRMMHKFAAELDK